MEGLIFFAQVEIDSDDSRQECGLFSSPFKNSDVQNYLYECHL